MPRVWTIRSRVGVDDQPWQRVPPAQLSGHEVSPARRRRRQSRHRSAIRSARPALAEAVVHDVAEERLGLDHLVLGVPVRFRVADRHVDGARGLTLDGDGVHVPGVLDQA